MILTISTFAIVTYFPFFLQLSIADFLTSVSSTPFLCWNADQKACGPRKRYKLCNCNLACRWGQAACEIHGRVKLSATMIPNLVSPFCDSSTLNHPVELS